MGDFGTQFALNAGQPLAQNFANSSVANLNNKNAKMDALNLSGLNSAIARGDTSGVVPLFAKYLGLKRQYGIPDAVPVSSMLNLGAMNAATAGGAGAALMRGGGINPEASNATFGAVPQSVNLGAMVGNLPAEYHDTAMGLLKNTEQNSLPNVLQMAQELKAKTGVNYIPIMNAEGGFNLRPATGNKEQDVMQWKSSFQEMASSPDENVRKFGEMGLAAFSKFENNPAIGTSPDINKKITAISKSSNAYDKASRAADDAELKQYDAENKMNAGNEMKFIKLAEAKARTNGVTDPAKIKSMILENLKKKRVRQAMQAEYGVDLYELKKRLNGYFSLGNSSKGLKRKENE